MTWASSIPSCRRSRSRVRELAEELNDTPGPVVTDFHGWGPWVNGGAWLTLGGQRVDFIYRSLEHVHRVIADADAGRYEVHHLQQPPFGFFSGIYLGEVAACVPLFDPEAQVERLKSRVAAYPEALRRAVVQDYLFMAEFNLTQFAPKCAVRADVHGTAACLARAVHELVMALFALNRQFLVNDRTALEEVTGFARAPKDFGPRVQKVLGRLGTSPAELAAAIECVIQLLRETVELRIAPSASEMQAPNLKAHKQRAMGARGTADAIAIRASSPTKLLPYTMKTPRLSTWLTVSLLLLAQTSNGATELLSKPQNLPTIAGAAGNTMVVDISNGNRLILLVSDAQNLMPQATSGEVNLFLFDRETAIFTLISSGLNGNGGDGPTESAFFSRDGKRVIFESRARNLTSEPVSGAGDLFDYDVETGVTRLISVNRDGTAGGKGRSHEAVLTPDGRYVAFVSRADDLVDGDNNRADDIFRRDLWEQRTELVTVSWTGSGSSATMPIQESASPSLSADGRHVAFISRAELVFPNPPSSRPQVFIRDMELGTNGLISAALNGLVPRTGESRSPVIAGDRVYFISNSPDVTTEGLLGFVLYSRPIAGGPTVRVSRTPESSSHNVDRFQIEGDAIAYSYGTTTNVIRLRDNAAGTDTLVTLNTNGAAPSGRIWEFQLSTDGRRLAFLSEARDLVPNDTGGKNQIYITDLTSTGNQLISRSATGEPGSENALSLAASGDLTTVAFSVPDSNLIPGDINRAVDAFLWDATTDEVATLSASAEGEASVTPLVSSSLLDVSGNGRYVLFTSLAGDLVENDANGAFDVFLYDREESVIMPLSFTPDGQSGNGPSWGAVMTPDARFVAFYTTATNLAGTDTNKTVDVYLRDVAMGTTHLVSEALDGLAGGEVDWDLPLIISSDGRWVGFVSTARNMSDGGDVDTPDFFLRDCVNATTYRVPPPPGSLWATTDVPLLVTEDGQVFYRGGGVFSATPGSTSPVEMIAAVTGLPAITPDARWIAYATGAVESAQSIWLLDTTAGPAIELISSPTPLFLEQARPDISADGGRVAFATKAPLSASDLNDAKDVYVVDRANPGVPVLVSARADGTAATGNSQHPQLSADGRFVAFTSTAADLVAGDFNASADIFVRDLDTQRTWLVSVSPLEQTTAQGWSLAPRISDDGGVVAFMSEAWDLSSRDWNQALDVFAWTSPVWSEGDQDGDGMDDGWEAYYFGGYHRDGLGDADSDGVSDALEFRAGTNPADALSLFALRYLVEANAGVLTWPGTADCQYQVEYRASLDDPTWDILPGQPEPAGDGWMRQLDPDFPTAAPRWFRVVLVEQ